MGTGHAIDKGIDYGIDYVEAIGSSSTIRDTCLISHNATSIRSSSLYAESGVSSILSQIVSHGGCGGSGVCTSVVATTYQLLIKLPLARQNISLLLANSKLRLTKCNLLLAKQNVVVKKLIVRPL